MATYGVFFLWLFSNVELRCSMMENILKYITSLVGFVCMSMWLAGENKISSLSQFIMDLFLSLLSISRYLKDNINNWLPVRIENRTSTTILEDSSYFAQKIPFCELFLKTTFKSSSDSYFVRNLRKFENAFKVRFTVWQIVQNLQREPSNGEVLKWIQLAPNLTQNKNSHSYPFLLRCFLRKC